MKKLLLAIAAFFAISCEGPQGMDGEDGKDGTDGMANWKVITIPVKPEDWVRAYSNNGVETYFYCGFKEHSIPDLAYLNDNVFNEGVVIGYLINTSSNGTKVKNTLPFVQLHNKENASPPYFWTKNIDFDFSPGFVQFYVTYSDFDPSLKPGSMDFEIVLMW